ncbi:MAG: hypothetical protein J6T87_02825, partial [Bacteroidales bacterium]|nr:hypothetical protein [Bacteroidales bacterium]
MKKQLTFLGVLLFLMAGALNAQVTQTNTQFPNPGFEKWTDHDCSVAQGTSEVPDNWHTFDEVKFDTWPGEATARKTSHFKLTGSNAHGGSGTALQIASHSALGFLANGTITSGRTRVGNVLSVSNYKNYNFSHLSGHSGPNNNTNYGNGHFYWNFIGCPDSMSFYYRTNWTDADKKPLIKVYLHQGEWYDHANKVVNEHGDSSTNHITHPNLIAYCQTTFAPSDDWKRFAGKFIQYGNHSENTDNIYSTIVRPQYILASFSTNENAGEGSTSDRLSIDDLWCIYDKGLASLTIGGTANTDGLDVFNAAEGLTHEPSRTYDDAGNPIFNNSGTATWTYPTPISCNNIPQISATPRSKLISQFTIMQAVPQNGYKATIYVKHNDNSEFYYYIQFTPALPNITLNNNGTYTACEGDDITVTASGASSYSWSDGLGSDATVHPTASGVYTVTGTANGCTSTATATVTINAKPSVNITGPASLCQGTTGTLTATGSFTFCTWDDNSTNPTRNISPTSAGPATYTVTVTGSNRCTNTVTKTVNVLASPDITVVSANTLCEGGDLLLTAETETEGANFAWSGPNGFTSNEQNPAIGNASTTMSGDYTVTVTDPATECSAADMVTVTVNQPTTGDTTATACESFDWYNHSNITESCSNLTHTLAGANINGCDSIVTLLLTINYGTHNAETESADESFTWHGTTYSTSGVYTYEYNNADGCASTDTLHLTINQGTQDTETVIALASGWNWVSFNVDVTVNDLKAALLEAVPNTAIQIKGKGSSTSYDPARN